MSPIFTKTKLIKACPIPTPTWYNYNWLYRKNITINKTAVAATLTNFPVLISYTDTDLKNNALSNGYDILFTDSNGQTVLSYEIENFTKSSGRLIAWVKVPNLPTSPNTTLYMYYGNAGASNQQSPTDVWDANFGGIWHLNGTLTDSTTFASNGVGYNSAADTSAKIGWGRAFSKATSSFITTPSQFLKTGQITVSLWFKAANTNFAGHMLWEGQQTASYSDGWGNLNSPYYPEMHLSIGDQRGSVQYSSYFSFFLGDRERNVNVLNISTPFTDTSSWHYATVVAGNMGLASANATLYLDGSSVGTDTGNAARTGTSAWDNPLRVGISGHPGNATRFFDGSLDEIRISNIGRSAQWILTEYRNQADPAHFHYNMTQEAWSC